MPLTLLKIVLRLTLTDTGTATDRSMTPVVVFTPVSGSPARLFLPNRFPVTTMPLTSCSGAWLCRRISRAAGPRAYESVEISGLGSHLWHYFDQKYPLYPTILFDKIASTVNPASLV